MRPTRLIKESHQFLKESANVYSFDGTTDGIDILQYNILNKSFFFFFFVFLLGNCGG